MQSLRVVQERDSLFIIHNEKYWFEIPYQQAKLFVNALEQQIKRCEEWDERERIIKDQAILMKTNHPFALSDNPNIIEQAIKEARNNEKLNKYIGSHVSDTLIGIPTITVADKEDEDATKR